MRGSIYIKKPFTVRLIRISKLNLSNRSENLPAMSIMDFDENNGRVGIGVTSPGYRLSVNGNTSDDLATLYATNNSTNTTIASHGVYGLTNSTNNLSAGVYGLNNSSGPGVFAQASGTTAALYAKSTNAFPLAGKFDGDVIVKGKMLTDSISINGPGAPNVGAVLISRDNIGNAKWSNPIMFKASFSPSSITTVNTLVITGIGGSAGYSSSVPVNVGGGLSVSPANMIFTAPVTGYYNLNASMLVSIYPSATGNAYVYMELYNNSTSSTIARGHSNNSDAGSFFYTTLQASTVTLLTQGQQVMLRVGGSITNSGTITNNYSANLINDFSGSLIR